MVNLEITDVRTSPQNPSFLHRHFFRRRKKPAYIVGERFDVMFKIKNTSGKQIRGGDFSLLFETQFTPENYYKVKIPKIELDGESEFSRDFSVLETGFSRILISYGYEFDVDNEIRRSTDGEEILFIFRKKEYSFNERIHIASVFGQNREEFYEYWALMFAVIGLLYPLLKDLITLLIGLFDC